MVLYVFVASTSTKTVSLGAKAVLISGTCTRTDVCVPIADGAVVAVRTAHFVSAMDTFRLALGGTFAMTTVRLMPPEPGFSIPDAGVIDKILDPTYSNFDACARGGSRQFTWVTGSGAFTACQEKTSSHALTTGALICYTAVCGAVAEVKCY